MTSLRFPLRVDAFAFLFLGLLFFIGQGAAQVTGGTIFGTISDNSGGNIPNATVSIKNTAQDLVRSLTTNEQGIYRAPGLIPGTYQITVSAPGFATVVRNDVTLTVGAELVISVQLRVGGVNEKVEINSDRKSTRLNSS